MQNRTWMLSAIVCGLSLTTVASGQMTREQVQQRINTMKFSNVEVIEEGQGPQKKLVLQVEEGARQTIEMRTEQKMSMTADGVPMPMPANPSVIITMDVVADKIDGDDGFWYTATVKKADAEGTPDVQPMVLNATRQALAQMKGAVERGYMASNGITDQSKSKLDLPDDADESMKAMMDQLGSLSNSGIPLPGGTVGVGAVWEMANTMEIMGAKFDTLARYTLLNVQGDTINVSVTMYQIATNQPMENPQMPGMTMVIESMFGVTNGTATIDLTRPMVMLSDARGTTNMNISIDMGGMKQSISQRVDSGVFISTIDDALDTEDVGATSY